MLLYSDTWFSMDNFSSANVISWLQTFITDESIIRYFRGKVCFVSFSIAIQDVIIVLRLS
jgi:hypothetical protein